MSTNLLETLQNYFIGATLRQTSAALGEPEAGVGTALRSALPLALGALLARSRQADGPADLLAQAQQAHGSGVLSGLSSLLGGLSAPASTAEGSLLSRGTDLMEAAMGGGYAPAIERVSQQAGIGPASTASLLSLAVPVALGLLGRHAAQQNLDAPSLGHYLGEQRVSIAAALTSCIVPV